jgi:hypothetical protein
LLLFAENGNRNPFRQNSGIQGSFNIRIAWRFEIA